MVVQERPLGTHISSVLVTDWLLQQTTTPGSTPISYKQEEAAPVGTPSPTLDKRGGEKHPGSCRVMLMAESGFGVSSMTPMDPSCLVSTVHAGGGDVMAWGMFSWDTLSPLMPMFPMTLKNSGFSGGNKRGSDPALDGCTYWPLSVL